MGGVTAVSILPSSVSPAEDRREVVATCDGVRYARRVIEWQPRFLQPGEEPALLEVLTSAFGTWPSVEISVDPIEHLRWKIEQSPERATVVTDGGSVICGLLMARGHVLSNGQVLVAKFISDVAVQPDYQGRGVLSSTSSFIEANWMETADLSFGYRSGRVAARKAYASMESGAIANGINVLVAPTHPAPLDDVSRDAWSLRPVKMFDERIDVFWNEASPQFDFATARSRDLLNWRYCDRRGGNFSVVLAEQDGRILGYAVERCSRGKGYIADLLALPGRLDVVSSLVGTALADLGRVGVKQAECWLTSRHAYLDTFASLGFKETGTKDLMYLPFKTPDSELSYLRSPRTAVHLSAGDTDLI